MRSPLLPLLLTAVALSSCLPLRQSAPYVPSIRLPLSSPYAKFMWSQYYPDTALVGAPNRIIAWGRLGLTAFDTYTGSAAWGNSSTDPTALFIRGSTLYRTVYNGLQAYDSQTGKLLWENRSLHSGNAYFLYVNSTNIFLEDQTNRFLILDTSGKFLQVADTSSAMHPLSLENGSLYFADLDGLHARNAKMNEPAWNASIQDLRQSLITDDVIYSVSEYLTAYHALYAVGKSNGRILWKWDEHARIISNLCILDSDIFFLTADGFLVALDKRTGRVITKLGFTDQPFLLYRAGQPVTEFQVAADPANQVLAIAFGDTYQIIALKLLAGPEVLIQKPL